MNEHNLDGTTLPAPLQVLADDTTGAQNTVAASSASTWKRIVAAILLTLIGWMFWLQWRPPAPMLGLRHQEYLGRDTPAISLNFDDAPHPVVTPLLLASLRRAGAKASFFVIGDGLKLYPELTHRMIDEGHALANHSQNHRNLTHVSPDDYPTEILDGFKSIARAYRAAGRDTQSQMFRPPGGGMNRQVMNFLYRNDIELAWWSNNVGDWAKPPGWKIVAEVNARLKPGDIILLHDAPGGYGTAQAIPAIVRSARRKNLQPVLMPDRHPFGILPNSRP